MGGSPLQLCVSASAEAEVMVQPPVTIESLTVSDDTPMPGQTVTYTLVISNRDPEIATGVAVSNTLPLGMSLVADSVTIEPTQGATLATTQTDLPALASNITVVGSSSVTLTYQALIAFDVLTDTVLTNQAAVTSLQRTIPATGEVGLTIDSTSTETLAFSGAGVYTANAGRITLEVVDDGGCLTGLQVMRQEHSHPNATAALETGRFWSLTPIPSSCTSGFEVNLTLPHPSETLDGQDQVCRYTGSDWDCGEESDHSFDAAAGTITRSGVTGFSDWTVGENSSCAATVPPANFGVSLAPAGPSQQDVSLGWLAYGAPYTVHHSSDDPYFTPLPGTVLAMPTTNSYTHSGALGNTAVNHFYLIEVANCAGTAQSSRVGTFTFEIEPGN